jgi:mRNA-decapping enzyme 1B
LIFHANVFSLGSFFVYSRVAEPFNSIFINNRLNTNSLVEPITKQIELQSQPPFLLYRNQRSVISGFWFYSKDDCVRVHALLEKLIKKCNNNARPTEHNNGNNHHPMAQQQQPAFMKNGNGVGKQDVDIFSMLSKAQEDFNNSTGTATENRGPPPPQQQQMNQKFAGMKLNNPPPQQQQPLVRQLSSAMPDITSPNVANFFATMQPGTSSKFPCGGGLIVKGTPCNQFGEPLNVEGPQVNQSQNNKKFMPKNPTAPPVQTLDEIEKQHRVSASPPQPKPVDYNMANLLNSVAQQQQPTISPQPMMIKMQHPGQLQGAFQPQPSSKPTLITPAMFQAPNVVSVEEKIAAPAPTQSNIRPEPLTQNQLIQALNYMLETDPEFIRKVHEAYVKSFNKIVSL